MKTLLSTMVMAFSALTVVPAHAAPGPADPYLACVERNEAAYAIWREDAAMLTAPRPPFAPEPCPAPTTPEGLSQCLDNRDPACKEKTPAEGRRG